MKNAGHDIDRNAVSYFTGGFNCAESVLKALCEALEPELQNCVKIATPFGGGIAGKGHLCGAVSGAVIAAGLCMGRVSPKEDRRSCDDVAGRFIDEFINEFHTVSCRDIIGVDLLSTEGRKKHKECLRDEKCCSVVEFAAKKMYSLIESCR
ncbi:MAG TPA: C-GCAxxG-C-C family protein [Bacillota bacterium]|nr:C-GCAxxG-C-C family protein [Bacillota bacterium]